MQGSWEVGQFRSLESREQPHRALTLAALELVEHQVNAIVKALEKPTSQEHQGRSRSDLFHDRVCDRAGRARFAGPR